VIHKQSLFEGPKVCHFYWNEEVEHFITFYHCPALGTGKTGTDTIHSISFSVSFCSFHYWLNRFRNWGIQFSQLNDNLHNAPILLFADPDGLPIKLVFTIKDNRVGLADHIVPSGFSIKGFYAVEISSFAANSLFKLLTEQFGLECKELYYPRRRFSTHNQPGTFIDVAASSTKEKGVSGWGRVHHIALWMEDWETCSKAFEQIQETKKESIFRLYPNQFSSLYFHEAEGILFELLGKKPFTQSVNLTDDFKMNDCNIKRR
jgi:glyoxalase family protein